MQGFGYCSNRSLNKFVTGFDPPPVTARAILTEGKIYIYIYVFSFVSPTRVNRYKLLLTFAFNLCVLSFCFPYIYICIRVKHFSFCFYKNVQIEITRMFRVVYRVGSMWVNIGTARCMDEKNWIFTRDFVPFFFFLRSKISRSGPIVPGFSSSLLFRTNDGGNGSFGFSL